MNNVITNNINYRIINNPFWKEDVTEITAFDFLNTGNVIQSKILLLERTKARYEEIADSTNGSNFGEVSSYDKHRERKAGFIKWIDKIMEVENHIENLKATLSAWIKLADTQIDKVENLDYAIILKLRFIEQMSYEEISKKIFVSLATVRRWNRLAIYEFQRTNGYSE